MYRIIKHTHTTPLPTCGAIWLTVQTPAISSFSHAAAAAAWCLLCHTLRTVQTRRYNHFDSHEPARCFCCWRWKIWCSDAQMPRRWRLWRSHVYVDAAIRSHTVTAQARISTTFRRQLQVHFLLSVTELCVLFGFASVSTKAAHCFGVNIHQSISKYTSKLETAPHAATQTRLGDSGEYCCGYFSFSF